MTKLSLTIIFSLVISFIATNILDDVSKKNWKMTLIYEHVERKNDVNYTLLDKVLNLGSVEKFSNFIAILDQDISLKNNENKCSEIRSNSSTPNILINLSNLAMRIEIVNNNKDLILDCEKYIDDQVNKFEVTNKLIAKKTLEYKERRNVISHSKTEIDQKLDLSKLEVRDFFKNKVIKLLSNNKKQLNVITKDEEKDITPKELVSIINEEKKTCRVLGYTEGSEKFADCIFNLYSKKNEKKFTENLLNKESLKMENIVQSLMLIDLLKEKAYIRVIDFEIDTIDWIIKQYRSIQLKEENKGLMFLSLFLITQAIITLIIYNKIIFSKRSNRKKIKSIFKI